MFNPPWLSLHVSYQSTACLLLHSLVYLLLPCLFNVPVFFHFKSLNFFFFSILAVLLSCLLCAIDLLLLSIYSIFLCSLWCVSLSNVPRFHISVFRLFRCRVLFCTPTIYSFASSFLLLLMTQLMSQNCVLFDGLISTS